MAESTASLRAEIKALSGVDIMLNENTFKSTYQIMDELSKKWGDLSDIAQATIIELVAGKHQGNVFSSLMANFDTAREALETSLTSSGSAMAEHEKWQKSLEAQINKLKAAWQGLSQAFLSSDFLKAALDGVIGLIDGLTKLIDTLGAFPTLLGVFVGFKGITSWLPKLFSVAKQVGGIKQLADIIPLLQLSFPNATAGVKGFTVALKAMLSTAMAHPVLLAIAAAATAVGVAFAYKSKKAKELAKSVDELTDKFNEQSKELKKLKGDYDTTNESSMISKYAKLSEGVDNLGRNVSLTADEYSDYQSIVNSIAEQIPSLITGYDEQGNALLSCKGNVEALTEAYEKLIHAQNQEILTNVGNIEKDFANTIDKADGDGWWSNGHGFWAGLWGGPIGKFIKPMVDYELKNDTVENIQGLLNSTSSKEKSAILKKLKADRFSSEEIRDALTSANIDVGAFEDPIKVLEETLETDPQKVKNIVDNYYAQFAEAIEEQKTIAQAKLSEAFDISSAISGLNYDNIGEDLQAIAYQTVNSLDLDFFTKLQEQGKTVEQWITEMLNQLNAISIDGHSQKIEAAFDLQTQFNGGEIPYGEYVEGLENTGKLIERLDLKPELKSQLKLSLGLDEDGLVAGYEKLKNRLADNTDFNIMPSEYEEFLKGLSVEEVSVLWEVIPKLEKSSYKESIEDIKAAIEYEMMLQGLTFDLNLEVEAAGLEALNTALAESVSATGLSSESINALKGRYSELEEQGYDLSSMFEETSTGIRINRQEFNKLEKAYATDKLAEIDSDLAEMKSTYDDLGEAIKNCDDPIRKSELFNDRQTLAKRISEAATLAAQYEGLTNAYNDWLSAEEAGQERDMYENVIKGFETVDDEISRGWIDDAAIEFLELLTGRTDLAGKSGKQLKEIYDGLGKTIENTGYSVRDFFTVDEDGNSTNTGVYNFLDAIGQLEEEKFNGKDVVKRDKDGNIIGFDFKLAGGDEVIAEALGVSEELVQIMVRAADDAGFVVSMDGTHRQLADLQNEAKAAADYLHQIGKTDFEFDFNTSSVKDLKNQLEEAHKILDDKKFWNKDGTFNFNADGATQAMQVVSTLQAKLDKLTEEKYGIGLTVEDEEFEEPLENLQEYGRNVATLNQLELNPKANAEEIEQINDELNEIAEYFANLDDDLKVQLGFESDDGIEEVKKKIESGEVKIPTVLDIQANMDKNIETLTDLALLNSGLLSDDEEEVIKKKYRVEPEVDVDDKTGIEGFNNVVEQLVDRDASINLVAEVTGTEDVEGLSEKLKDIDDKTVQAIANVIGQANVDLLRDTIARLKPTEVEAIAKAIGQGDVDSLQEALLGIDSQYAQAIAEAFGYDDVNDLCSAIDSLDPKTVQAVAEALGITDVESLKGAIDNVQGKDVEVNATTSGESKLSGLKKLIDDIKGKTVDVVVNTIRTFVDKVSAAGKEKAGQRTGANPDGKSGVNGTAHVDGTAGRAFKQGSWRTKKTETALTGELGREIVVTPQNRWYTVGDNGAEFVNIPRGSIIFNHRQTEELLRNGKATSDGGRAKAFANGTAFSVGLGGIGRVDSVVKVVAIDGGGGGTSNNNNNNSGSSAPNGGLDPVGGYSVGSNKKTKEAAKDFKETFDFVEIAIERIERAIDSLDRKSNNVYKSWSERNSALTDEIEKVREEITTQEKAYIRYMEEANSVGLSGSGSGTSSGISSIFSSLSGIFSSFNLKADKLSSSVSGWAKKIQDGAIDIDTITDENLAEKIGEYEEWYNKALDCLDAIEELKEKEAELYAQRVENVATQYEGILGVIEHEKNMLEEYISQSEAQGWLVSSKYYDALASNERENITELEKQKAEMLTEFEKAMDSGTIAEGSEGWYEMVASIDEVTLAITESQTALLEYEQTLQQLSWEAFDLLQDRISAVSEEANFLIELLSNDKLFDDGGQMTDEGKATMGLHGQNYNTYMYQADQAAAEAARIKKELESDHYDTELEERYREMIALQHEYILAAEDEKEAIRDLVEEGIQLELDALQERIDKYNEAIESQKDLYDYQKNVKKQSEEIASLEKQRAAYLGDTSDEGKAKLQSIEVSLKEAKDGLEETEYDRYITGQQQLLDQLYLDYEETLNMRLDNIDALITDMIEEVNADASIIGGAINEAADLVGYTLSNSMMSIWDANSTKTNDVITTYGEKFLSASTTTNNALSTINTNLQNVITQLNSIANAKVKSASTSSVAKSNSKSKPTNTASSKKQTVTNDTLMGIASAIWVYGSESGWGNNPFRENKLKDKLGASNAKKVQEYVNKYGGSGGLYKVWIDKNKNLSQFSYAAFATGARQIGETQLAWTQENGREFIVRPSDGAILTPVAKYDSVLNAQASNNIWDMANSPADFIKDNLNFGATSVPNNSNVQSSCVQNFDKIVFNMPNVKNYGELLTEMQKDPKFEKLILSMTIDQIAGKSSLAKGKSIR